MSRSKGYNNDEDRVLCQAYLEISQDPIIGKYQTRDRFWSRVEDVYNKSKQPGWDVRPIRSLENRIKVIEKAVRKLNACIRQVENTNPSGASEHDILERGKHLLCEDNAYKKGFKFDHVWNMMKNFKKIDDNVMGCHNSNYVSSESSEPNTPCSDGVPSFNLTLNDGDGDDDAVGGSSYERPIGVKKAKLKRKIDEKKTSNFDNISEQNEKIMKMMEKTDADRQKFLAMKEQRREDKMLAMDLNIVEPNIRAHIQLEQAKIIQKRAEQYQQAQPHTSNVYGQFYGNYGGDGSVGFGGDGSKNLGGGSGNCGGDVSGIPEY